jgi:hypothetical protein
MQQVICSLLVGRASYFIQNVNVQREVGLGRRLILVLRKLTPLIMDSGILSEGPCYIIA